MLRRIRQLHLLHQLLLGVVAVAILAIGMPPCAGLMGDVQAESLQGMGSIDHHHHHTPEHPEHGTSGDVPAFDDVCHGDDCAFMKAVDLPQPENDIALKSPFSAEPAALSRAELRLPEPPRFTSSLLPAARLPASPVMEHRVLRI